MVNQGDERAAHFFQLERLGFFLVYVGQIDAQIAPRGGMQQQRIRYTHKRGKSARLRLGTLWRDSHT